MQPLDRSPASSAESTLVPERPEFPTGEHARSVSESGSFQRREREYFLVELQLWAGPAQPTSTERVAISSELYLLEIHGRALRDRPNFRAKGLRSRSTQ